MSIETPTTQISQQEFDRFTVQFGAVKKEVTAAAKRLKSPKKSRWQQLINAAGAAFIIFIHILFR